MPNTISLKDFRKILAAPPEGTLCVDVRTPVEYRSAHIEGVVNIPLQDLSSHLEKLKGCSTVYVHCKTGGRAEKACAQLTECGVDCFVKVEGGIDDWIRKGLPVIRGKQTISLMRQVQICAGSLTVLGISLGFTVHPNWFYLSGFIGAGLLFAGVSGTCGMATALAKMPWNK